MQLVRIRVVRLAISLVLCLLKLLVKVGEQHPEPETADNSDAKHGRDNAVALPVSIFRKIPDVRASDVAQLTECVDHGDGDGTLRGRAWEG